MSLLATGLATVVGGVAGAAAGADAFRRLTSPRAREKQTFGPWGTGEGVGQTRQNAYARARMALHGIWALPASEAIYFSAETDSTGAPFDIGGVYEVAGGPQPARWWSLALYKDKFFIENAADRYSWSASDSDIDPSGRWVITLAPSGEGRNRLTLGPTPGRLQLVFRLYQPEAGIAEHRDRVPLPVIRRMAGRRAEQAGVPFPARDR